MAEVGSKSVAASGPVETRVGVAFINAELAVGTGVAGWAEAGVGVDAIDARPVIHARAGGAVFVIRLAVGAGETQRASASVRVDVVAAGGSVAAGIGGALVNVRLAVFASKAVDAEAGVLSDAVETRSAVLARECGAVVRVGQAVASFVAFGAEADVRAVGVLTGGAVATWRRNGALVNVFVAKTASVAQFASAEKVHKVARRRAFGSVAALVGSARIQLGVAVASRVGQLADALVIVDQIDAGTSVATRCRRAIVYVELQCITSNQEKVSRCIKTDWLTLRRVN